MKHLIKLFTACLLFIGLGANAQDSNNPWAITIGTNAIDGGRVSAAKSVQSQFSEFFNTKDYWSISPTVSAIGVTKHVGGNFSFGVTGTFNKITKFVLPKSAGQYPVVNPDVLYYGVDGAINYSFGNLFNFLEPVASIGGGYTFLGDNSAGNVNGGLGFNFWFSETIGLSLRSTYKHSFDEVRTSVPTHMQHMAGLTFKFGGKDTDGDGIYDKDDECPEVFGLAQFNGCPDSDGDGIPNHKDDCPDTFGLAQFNGCPDTDGDGIMDKNDDCPEVAGLAALKGCPDTDGDGIADKDDKCPTVAGPKENNGCPWPDRDGDGVLDKDDKCPDVKGTVANNGCPEVSPEAVKQLNDFAKSILFDTGKSTIKKASFTTLASIKNVMNEYPFARFRIEGHTDSTGSLATNERLSKERAASIKDYLIANGVDASRLESEGFGPTRPVADNKTAAGRAQNRRTEVVVIQ